jgi:hypothetical protein
MVKYPQNIQGLKDWKPSEALNDDVLSYYDKLVKQGKIEEAIDFIASQYPLEIAYIVKQQTRNTLSKALEGPMTQREMAAFTREIGFTIGAAKEAIVEGVRYFSTNVIAKHVFETQGITKKSLKDAILKATIDQFETYIDGAMSGTQAEILADIRSMQRDWIIRNQNIRKMKDVDDLLYGSEKEFKKFLRKKYPRLFKAMEEGAILKSRPWEDKNGNIKNRYYDLEEYTDFSVRATVLNIDRNSAEVSAQMRRHRVVEYYLRDNRPIKTEERPVCQHILDKKVHGKSLLALDDEAAGILGIMTIHRAKTEGAMFIHCRHSIKPVSKAFNEQVNKVIYLKKSQRGAA